MPRETVRRLQEACHPPDALWAVAAEFSAPWHPFVAEMQQERSAGRIIRRFTVQGETTRYREELTYLSHSDYTYSYRMLDGIEGVHHYAARLKIGPSEAGSLVTWQAEIEASADRIVEIAEGTGAVFDAGLAELARPQVPAEVEKGMGLKSRPAPPVAKLGARVLSGTPQLALSYAPHEMSGAPVLVLFLHGIGGNRTNWAPQLTALENEFPVAALDLRGYGESTLGFEPSTIDAYCEDIRAVMAAFHAERLVLVGLSYGSWIATSFAMRCPELLAGLVLSGGCTGMSEAGPDEREAFRLSREVPLDAGQTPADFAPAVVDVLAGSSASDEVRAQLRESMAAIPAQTYRDALRCFTNPLEKFDFGRIACPVLLMTGAEDRLAPPDEIRRISHRIHEAPGRPHDAGPVQFEVIPEAGHLCNLEQPEIYNAHLSQFLHMLGLRKPTKGQARKQAAREEKRARILSAALREFAQNGYAGASMQAIAQAAGVSKPTLYQYIGQKEDLFAAMLETGRARLLLPFEGRGADPMVPVLWDFAQVYAEFVLERDILALARLVIGEAERLPDLARRYVEQGPERAFAGIRAYLEGQVEQGRLHIEPLSAAAGTQAEAIEQAAEHLWALILSAPRTQALHFPSAPPRADAVEAWVRSGLAVFLRAYSKDPEGDLALLREQRWTLALDGAEKG